jgi:hypothetical protein
VNKADGGIHVSGEQWRQMLSQREHQVLKLLADCKRNKDIADELHISVRTAENISRTSDDETGPAFYRSLDSLCGAEQNYQGVKNIHVLSRVFPTVRISVQFNHGISETITSHGIGEVCRLSFQAKSSGAGLSAWEISPATRSKCSGWL